MSAEEEVITSIRIVLLFTGLLIVTSSGVARAALQPVDPAHAPVAAVDGFSDTAVNICGARPTHVFQVRTSRSLRHSPLEQRSAFHTWASRRSTIIWTYRAPHRRRSTSCIARARQARAQLA